MLIVKHAWACDICGRVVSIDHAMFPGLDVPSPELPTCWSLIENRVVCDGHLVTVQIRDKEPVDGVGV